MRRILLLLGLFLFTPSPVQAMCYRIEITEWSPTGVAGCEVYGEGLASWWAGPGVARNDCLWPWTRCAPIRVIAIHSGRSITVVPTMFCDCFTGTPMQRLIDLDPSSLKKLGLWESRAQGLFPVTVQPAQTGPVTVLPDTALAMPLPIAIGK